MLIKNFPKTSTIAEKIVIKTKLLPSTIFSLMHQKKKIDSNMVKIHIRNIKITNSIQL